MKFFRLGSRPNNDETLSSDRQLVNRIRQHLHNAGVQFYTGFVNEGYCFSRRQPQTVAHGLADVNGRFFRRWHGAFDFKSRTQGSAAA